MITMLNPKIRITKKGKLIIEWLIVHGIKGKLLYKDGDTLAFLLRKSGMLTPFRIYINYNDFFLPLTLMNIDKILTERAEQEEYGKQCGIVLHRIQKLSGLERLSTSDFINSLDNLENCEGANITEEVLKLREEYHRLYPQAPFTYKDEYEDYYCIRPIYSSYWDRYISDFSWRLEPYWSVSTDYVE